MIISKVVSSVTGIAFSSFWVISWTLMLDKLTFWFIIEEIPVSTFNTIWTRILKAMVCLFSFKINSIISGQSIISMNFIILFPLWIYFFFRWWNYFYYWLFVILYLNRFFSLWLKINYFLFWITLSWNLYLYWLIRKTSLGRRILILPSHIKRFFLFFFLV